MMDLEQSSPMPRARHDGVSAAVNYYRVLDVAPDATRLQIREAYLRLKNTYGAGSAALYSLVSEADAVEQMALVETAFRVLEDDVQRRQYDQSLGLAPGVARQGAVGDLSPDGAVGSRLAANFYGTGAVEAMVPGLDSTGNAGGEQMVRMPETSIIQTTRSILPIIKLKANRAGSEAMLSTLRDIVNSGDPSDGDMFRRLREACEVSEDEMCDRTKVSIGYIQAIESNRFERLPQAVYVKGFLRSYFRYLGMPDAEALVSAFSLRLMEWQASRKG